MGCKWGGGLGRDQRWWLPLTVALDGGRRWVPIFTESCRFSSRCVAVPAVPVKGGANPMAWKLHARAPRFIHSSVGRAFIGVGRFLPQTLHGIHAARIGLVGPPQCGPQAHAHLSAGPHGGHLCLQHPDPRKIPGHRFHPQGNRGHHLCGGRARQPHGAVSGACPRCCGGGTNAGAPGGGAAGS